MILCPPLHVGHPKEFAPEAALEDVGLPQRGPDVEVAWLLGLQGPWQGQCAGTLATSGAGVMALTDFSSLRQLALKEAFWLVLLCCSACQALKCLP